MRSRLTITATLVAGLLLSGGGAALGVSALTTSPSASVAQYGGTTTTTSTTTAAPVTPAGASNVPTTPGPVVSPSGELAEEEPTIASTPSEPLAEEADAQAPRQLAAEEDDELPFTGYAAIPILLIGLALLATGLVLRRRAGESALS